MYTSRSAPSTSVQFPATREPAQPVVYILTDDCSERAALKNAVSDAGFRAEALPLAAVLIAILQAIVAAIGWFAIEPVVLAITIAAQLALGGLAAAYVIGPARPDSGLARYAMPAVAGIAATVFGRLIPGGVSVLLVPILAVLLWSVTYLELRLARGTGGRTIQNLLLTAIVFTGAWGLLGYFGAQTWPSPDSTSFRRRCIDPMATSCLHRCC